MGTHGGGGDSNGKQSPLQPLVRQNSMYSLTLDEVGISSRGAEIRGEAHIGGGT